jgi:hypothetical protein
MISIVLFINNTCTSRYVNTDFVVVGYHINGIHTKSKLNTYNLNLNLPAVRSGTFILTNLQKHSNRYLNGVICSISLPVITLLFQTPNGNDRLMKKIRHSHTPLSA